MELPVTMDLEQPAPKLRRGLPSSEELTKDLDNAMTRKKRVRKCTTRSWYTSGPDDLDSCIDFWSTNLDKMRNNKMASMHNWEGTMKYNLKHDVVITEMYAGAGWGLHHRLNLAVV